MDKKHVPDIVVARLPLYLQTLNKLQKEGVYSTSSKDLGELIDISAAQIRKDLSHFGEFGKQGTGYSISFLIDQLEKILNVDKKWGMALVGVGFLGHAIANFDGFNHHGFELKLIFDSDPEKVGAKVGGYIVQDSDLMEELIQKESIRVAMITVDSEHAQEVADVLVKAGVKAILNYAPTTIRVPEGVQIQYIDPIIELQHMSFYLD